MTRLILAALFASALPILALDVSGKVVNKGWAPISDAQICLQASPTTCARSSADGSFHIYSGSVGVSPGDVLAQNVTLDFSRGVFSVTVPASARARAEWFDAKGFRLEPAREMDLSAGRNSLAPPQRGGGHVVFLRLSTAAFTATWKTVLSERREPGSSGTGAQAQNSRTAFVALAKVAIPSALLISKAGYATATYQPAAEKDSNDFVVLAAPGEKVSLLFDGKTLNGWLPSSGKTLGEASGTWTIVNGALHMMGTVRGTLASVEDYGDFRIIFSVRQLPRTAGAAHMPCFLFWGSRPPPNDALGAIQVQPPRGYMWDYRPGKPGNISGARVGTASIDETKWSQCEILARQTAGVMRLACCQQDANGDAPCKGVELIKYTDRTAGHKGPIGLQTHNAGLHDEFKNITMEVDPPSDSMFTVK